MSNKERKKHTFLFVHTAEYLNNKNRPLYLNLDNNLGIRK